MRNPGSLPANEMHKILLDFKIQIDHLISALVMANKKKKRTSRIVGFAVPEDYSINIKER